MISRFLCTGPVRVLLLGTASLLLAACEPKDAPISPHYGVDSDPLEPAVERPADPVHDPEWRQARVEALLVSGFERAGLDHETARQQADELQGWILHEFREERQIREMIALALARSEVGDEELDREAARMAHEIHREIWPPIQPMDGESIETSP